MRGEDFHEYWLWIGASSLALAGLAVTIAVGFDATHKHFAFWSSGEMVTAYLLILVAGAAFVWAVRSGLRHRTEGPSVRQGESLRPGSLSRLLDDVLVAPGLQEERGRDSDQLGRLRARLAGDYARFLRQAVHGHSVRVELGLNSEPGAVSQGLDRYLLRERSTQALAPGVTARDVFRAAGDLDDGRLLILGAPGSGKTIMLLEFAEALLSENPDGERPLPVYVPLSSWSAVQTRLERLVLGRRISVERFATYVVEQIRELYRVPRRTAGRWLAEGQLVLLLDGLDEIPDVDDRQACVAALNEFTRDRPGPVVVCCRREEYEALDVQLAFTAAVLIRPLQQNELDRALTGAGPSLAGVQAVLVDDPALRDLCRTPLFLSIVILAYAGMTPDQIRSNLPLTQRRAKVLDDYVLRRIRGTPSVIESRRQGLASEAQEKTLRWLTRLALEMESTKESILLLDRIQPSWLPSALRVAALAPALLLFWLVHYFVGFVAAVIPSLILFGALATSYRFTERVTWTWKLAVRPQTWLTAVAVGGWLGLVIGLAGGAVLPSVTVWPVHARLASPLAGVLIGAVIGLPVVSFLMGFRTSAIATSGSPYAALRRTLGVGLSVALLTGLATVVVYTAVVKVADVEQFVTARGSVHIFSHREVNAAVASAVSVAVAVGLYFGLGGVLGHFWVRMGLGLTGRGPFRYRTWLEEMVDARLLYRSGAGYVFIHRFLQERLGTLNGGDMTGGPSEGLMPVAVGPSAHAL